ncbi:MAG: sigma-54 dependent transcriptional regulator [Gammaproteobacteria bacterium]|nr:sigma-54 dependent transcriptional regulator [Gammaproteobacteria bacterium]MDP2140256.1 sigma-54 dependent transcriptional regulator [Gammaproteobacteria bacterium]MDP2348131.1 sigma-54 dependent transcriptional regulator [Gammaproteobacteria bacterium]
MQIISSDRSTHDSARMLDGFDYPAILVSNTYQILAANELYIRTFGAINTGTIAYCYRISHHYDKPCDQAGESCPLAACRKSGHREKVLHVHNTPRGREHVDVEMLPILDDQGELKYFVELLKPVAHASAQASTELMVGTSRKFNTLVEMINRVAPSDATVLLLGESGTGKELAAKAIHEASSRKDKPFVTVECAGLTETLFESELFGHAKGAFTGATYTKQGLVDAANGGTLFLDEIGDIPLPLQVKLLRLIETGTYRQVGSVEARSTDFRLVCATHKNLRAMVLQGQFREDLYYRVNVFPIHLPALRERTEDIPLIARSLLRKISTKQSVTLTTDAESLLKATQFSGNVRELRNILERAVLLSTTSEITSQTLSGCLDEGMLTDSNDEPTTLHHLERQHLNRLLFEHHGDKQAVADLLGISLRTLYRKLNLR